jgi:hypothetical protein
MLLDKERFARTRKKRAIRNRVIISQSHDPHATTMQQRCCSLSAIIWWRGAKTWGENLNVQSHVCAGREQNTCYVNSKKTYSSSQISQIIQDAELLHSVLQFDQGLQKYRSSRSPCGRFLKFVHLDVCLFRVFSTHFCFVTSWICAWTIICSFSQPTTSNVWSISCWLSFNSDQIKTYFLDQY